MWQLKDGAELSPSRIVGALIIHSVACQRIMLFTTAWGQMTPLPGNGDCCLPRSDGITYLKIGEQGITVGMQGLEVVFQQLALLNRQPEEASDEELIGMARRYNYIPRRATIEHDYAQALRQAYAAYLARQK
ncbi:MAG: hypothetical protein Kow0088_24790 [Anaerolineales bacterium]